MLQAWINGREKRALRKPFLEEMKISMSDGVPKTDDIKTSELIEKAEDMAITTIIVSINGSTENILKTILDMKEKDYSFVIEEINKISGDADFQKPRQKEKNGTE